MRRPTSAFALAFALAGAATHAASPTDAATPCENTDAHRCRSRAGGNPATVAAVDAQKTLDPRLRGDDSGASNPADNDIDAIGRNKPGATTPPPRQAGIAQLRVADVEPFDATVWYPTTSPTAPWQAGPFRIDATRDAPIADARFPVVVLSHGRRGGSLSHRDLAARLARDGFIVVAPTHVGDASGHIDNRPQRQILIDRPRQARAALTATLADPRFTSHADATRVGMIGFSAGGYTTLVLAGAPPDFNHAAAYCRDHADDRASCPAGNAGATATERERAAQSASASDDTPQPATTAPRLKAIVLMDPLAMPFTPQGLAQVRAPTLLIRPENDSYMPTGPNAAAVASNVSGPVTQTVVPGNHFVFIAPCPAAVAAEAPLACKDAPGVDRTAIHRQLEDQISAFLRGEL